MEHVRAELLLQSIEWTNYITSVLKLAGHTKNRIHCGVLNILDSSNTKIIVPLILLFLTTLVETFMSTLIAAKNRENPC